MSNNITFNTDTREVQRMMDYFKNNDWVRAESNALRKVGREVRKYERQRMKSMFPASTHRNPKYTDKLIDAIRATKVKKKKYQIQVNVHTMGSRKKTSGTFRARFFNNSKGTERHTKPFVDKLGRNYRRGRSTGVLNQIHYFDENPSSVVSSTIDKEIKDAIERINNKKYNK